MQSTITSPLLTNALKNQKCNNPPGLLHQIYDSLMINWGKLIDTNIQQIFAV